MHLGEPIGGIAAGKELDVSLTTAFPNHGSLRQMSDRDRLEFESLLLYLRLSFLLAPLLLIAAYGMRAVMPAIDVEVAVLADCAVVCGLLRWFPALALQGQLALRGMDLTVTFVALHFVHLFLGNAYYDSVYLLFVVAATATHGRRGTYLVATVSAVAILAGRTVLILGHVFPFQVRHITDSLFYALLFLTTGITTEFLMRKSAETVALRDREAAEAVRESEERYHQLFENATDIVYEHDLEGNFTSFNRAAENLLGYSNGDLPGLNIRDVIDPRHLDRAQSMFQAKLRGEGSTTYELLLSARHGGKLYVEVSSQIIGKGGRPIAVQGIARDITVRKSVEERLRHEALHDSLTGLPNRVLFHDRLLSAAAAARRSGRTIAVLMLDLDRFKPVNDTFGHSCGDDVLRDLAHSVARVLRESDTVARIGGDEFAVLLADTDPPGAVQVAEKLVQVVRQPRDIEGRLVSVGTSIGISLFPDQTDDVDVLLQQADSAMYAAKHSGSGHSLFSAGETAQRGTVGNLVSPPID
jgi:diguanylate cyclase (GGDEF)-like protein/PAS domain S-box-containing protein